MSNNEIYFEPKEVNDIFVEITKVPHCSKHEGEVEKDVVKKHVDAYNQANPNWPIQVVHYDPDAAEPGQRVIVLRREASPGMEDKPTIILQGHMDMVCVPDGNIFPIKLNKFTDANGVEMLKGGGNSEQAGTTLGADDGIGIATALAIISNTEKKTGPIECLFTVQEEVDMGGAQGMDVSWLKGETLVNLDSETDNVITFGSAGGSCATYELKIEKDAIPKSYLAASVSVTGLTGGHSGVDIDKGRGNAIKILTHLARHLRAVKGLELNITGFEAGTYSNAIPNKAVINVVFPPKADDDMYGIFHRWCNEILGAYRNQYAESDPGFDWYIESTPAPKEMLKDDSTDKLVDLLALIPTGPRKMLAQPREVVETSSNLAIIQTDLKAGTVTMTCSNRSASDASLMDMEVMEKAIANLFGASIEMDDRYPGWRPDPESPVLKAAEAVYNEVYKGDFKAEVIHAGLECGFLMGKFKDAGRSLDCIAIGPTILTPHTWNERLETGTVPTFFQCVTGILEKLWA